MNKEEIETYLNLDPDKRNSEILFRDILFNNIFADDKNKILYYSGKDLAANFEFPKIEDITSMYTELGFGNVILIKVQKNMYFFESTGEELKNRFAYNSKPEFALETGFLAQAIGIAVKSHAEGQFKVKRKDQTVEFLIQTISN